VSAFTCQLDEAADRVHQPHLLDRLAVRIEQARGAHQHDAALGARGGDVDAVAVEGEVLRMVGDLRESGLDEEADLLDEAAPKLAPEAYGSTVRKNLNYESWQTRRNRRA